MSETKRCVRCGWPLASTAKEGCVPLNCSFRASPGTPAGRHLATFVRCAECASGFSTGCERCPGYPAPSNPRDAEIARLTKQVAELTSPSMLARIWRRMATATECGQSWEQYAMTLEAEVASLKAAAEAAEKEIVRAYEKLSAADTSWGIATAHVAALEAAAREAIAFIDEAHSRDPESVAEPNMDDLRALLAPADRAREASDEMHRSDR